MNRRYLIQFKKETMIYIYRRLPICIKYTKYSTYVCISVLYCPLVQLSNLVVLLII